MNGTIMGAPAPRRKGLMTAGLAALGLVVGAPAGFMIGGLIKHAGASHRISWSDTLSLALAAMLTVSGAAVLAATLTRASIQLLADPYAEDDGRPVARPQVDYFRLHGAVMLLAGLMLATPVLLALVAPQASRNLVMAAYLTLFALFLAQTVMNWMVWRRSDELARRAIGETAAASFWLLQGALFLWAAGERMALLPALRSWDAMTVLMAAYLLMPAVVAWRRGLA